MEVEGANAVIDMKLVIADVSVLFDLFHIKALKEFFELDFEICTTIYVFNEIVLQEQIDGFELYSNSGQLKILELLPEEEEFVYNFRSKRNLRSIPDKTLLWKSMQMRCILLTCDYKLRKEGEDNGIEVHGSIWVVSELVSQMIIGEQKAIEYLEHLKTVNNRLPIAGIDEIIVRFKSELMKPKSK